MGVERFFADRELLCQVVHGYAAESVAKEVCSRRLHDPLPTGIGCLVPPQELEPVFHISNCFILHYRNYISIFSFQNQEKMFKQNFYHLPDSADLEGVGRLILTSDLRPLSSVPCLLFSVR